MPLCQISNPKIITTGTSNTHTRHAHIQRTENLPLVDTKPIERSQPRFKCCVRACVCVCTILPFRSILIYTTGSNLANDFTHFKIFDNDNSGMSVHCKCCRRCTTDSRCVCVCCVRACMHAYIKLKNFTLYHSMGNNLSGVTVASWKIWANAPSTRTFALSLEHCNFGIIFVATY